MVLDARAADVAANGRLSYDDASTIQWPDAVRFTGGFCWNSVEFAVPSTVIDGRGVLAGKQHNELPMFSFRILGNFLEACPTACCFC